MRLKTSAFTLVEVLLSAAIGAFLLGITFLIFLMQARAVSQADSQTDALQNLLKLQSRLTGEGSQTTASAMSFDTNSSILSFPNSNDVNNEPVLDSSGYPLWQRYIIYYWQPDQTVRLSQVPIRAPQTRTCLPLEAYPDQTGIAHDLPYYAKDGRVVARSISKFQMAWSSGVFVVDMQAQQVDLRSTRPATVSLKTYITPRN